MLSAGESKDQSPAIGADEARWLAAHRVELQVYRDHWIAISGSAVVGVARDASEALDLAIQGGARDPLLYFVADPAVKSRARIA